MSGLNLGAGRLCPGCGDGLAAATVDKTEVVVCGKCSHVSVSQRGLAGLLEAASVRVLQEVDLEHRMAPLARLGQRTGCPSCRRPMAVDDYCGAGVVEFDRCERCELLWVGPEQLGAMSMLWARMNKRIELVHAFNEERLKDAGDFVDVTLLGRAMAGMLGRYRRLGYDGYLGIGADDE